MEDNEKQEPKVNISRIPPLIKVKSTQVNSDQTFQKAFQQVVNNREKQFYYFVNDSIVMVQFWKFSKEPQVFVRCQGQWQTFLLNQKQKAWQFIRNQTKITRTYGQMIHGQVYVRNHRKGTTGPKYIKSQKNYPSQYNGDHIEVKCSSEFLQKLIQQQNWEQVHQLIIKQQRQYEPNVVYFEDYQ